MLKGTSNDLKSNITSCYFNLLIYILELLVDCFFNIDHLIVAHILICTTMEEIY